MAPCETCTEFFGTICYTAPEVLLHKPFDKKVDCWALGIITCLMLTGYLPFDSYTDTEIATKTCYK